MTKLWSDNYDYNKLVENYPDWWKKGSRENVYRFLHKEQPRYLIDIIKEYNAQSILDYGCGNSTHIEKLCQIENVQLSIGRYDPFVELYRKRPSLKFDLVVCFNVLSVVEHKFLNGVIRDICDYANKAVIIRTQVRNETDIKLLCECLKNIELSTKEFSIASDETYRKVLNISHRANECLISHTYHAYILLEK
jgi:nitrogen regulatory protein PII-like uncharacterized protein